MEEPRSERYSDHYDVVVVGGSFSGAATALQLKRQLPDRRILIVERQAEFGRRVGEATVELSARFLTRVLGEWDLLSRDHLPKHGLRYWFSDGPGRSLAEMTEIGPRQLPSLPSFQLDRARLDQALLDRAVAEGIELERPSKVVGIDLDWPAHRVRLDGPDGSRSVTARWVVDASGRQAMLARQLGTFRRIENHPTAAVWARWSSVADMDSPGIAGSPGNPRLPPVAAARRLATNHFCGYGWWCWVIPLASGETSIGLVYDKRLFRWPTEGSLRERFVEFVTTRVSGLAEILQGASIDEDDFLACSDLPYRSTRTMGPGWAMVGDAAAFMDPYYSPGLDHASITSFATVDTIAGELTGKLSERSLEERIAVHNQRFSDSYDRWLDGLYLDKYEILGDAELTTASFLFDTGMYFLGVLGPILKDPQSMGNPPFGVALPQSRFAYGIMRFFKGRMIRLARFRRRSGLYGRRNLGWKYYPPSFAVGARSVRLVFQAVLLWLGAERQYLMHCLRHGRVDVSAPVEIDPTTGQSEPAPGPAR